MADSVETAIYRLRVEGEEEIQRVTTAIDGLVTAEEDATASNRKLTSQIERGLASYDAVLKAQQLYTRELELNKRARESGANSLQELDAHLGAITQKYQNVTRTANEAAVATENLRRAQANAAAGTSGFSTVAAGPGSYAAEFDRMMTIAEGKAAQIAKAFGEELDERMIAGTQKAARDSASVFSAEMDRLATIAKLKAEQAGKNFQDSLNAQMGIGAGASKSARESFAVFEQAGAIPAATTHMTQLGNATKVARYEMINLGRQANDVVVSLVSGMNPLMVIIQQGSQIWDVFTSSERTALDLLKQAGAGIMSFLTNPITLAIGAVTALVGVTLSLANAWDKVNVSAQRAISGAGARTGTTVSDINEFVSKNTPSVTTGAGLSQKESRALAEGLTQTGDIVIAKLHSMSDAVMGFSNITKKSMDESVKAFIQFGKDPKKAMDDLAEAFGPLGNATRDMVEHYLVLGDKTSAFNVLLDATAKKAKEAAENMQFLEKAGRGAVNALQTPGQRSTGLETQLETTRQKLNEMIESAQKWAEVGRAAPVEVSRGIEILSREFEKLSARQQAVKDTAAGDTFKNIEDRARAVTEAVIPQIEQIEKLTKDLRELRAAEAQGSGGADNSAAINAKQIALEKTIAIKNETARANEYTLAIAGSWGQVSAAVAATLHELQQQLDLAQQITPAQQMKVQYEIDFANAAAAGKSEIEAQAIAEAKFAVSAAQADAAVQKQIDALEQSTRLIKAQAAGHGESTARAIAYENAIKSGASETQAAALSAAMLANNIAKAAASAGSFAQQMAAAGVSQSNMQAGMSNFLPMGTGDGSGWVADNAGTQGSFQPNVMSAGPQGSMSAFNPVQISYKGGGRGMNLDVGGGIVDFYKAMLPNDPAGTQQLMSALQSGGVMAADQWLDDYREKQAADAAAKLTGTQNDLYELNIAKAKASGDTGAQLAAYQAQLGYVMGQPESADKYNKIASLQSAIESLTKSTDKLNDTNQELLSPYYTMDPRTSHIGFRSQGMAGGGYVDVPGGYSANDNMLAEIPVASGERIYVDPMTNRRGTSGGGGMTINISSPITINGNANADQFGRTLYQSNQILAKQVRSAAQ